MTTYDPDSQEQDRTVLQRIVDDYAGRFALGCYVIEPGEAAVGDEAVLLGHWTLTREVAERQLGAVRPSLRTGTGEVVEEEEGLDDPTGVPSSGLQRRSHTRR